MGCTILGTTGFDVLEESSGKQINTYRYDMSAEQIAMGLASGQSSAAGKLSDVFDLAFMYLPETNAVMKFDYGLASENISLIDVRTGDLLWKNDQLRWSLERYGNVAGAATNLLTKNLAAKAGTEIASEILFKRQYIQNITNFVDGTSKMLIRTYDGTNPGLSLMNINSGEILWKNNDINTNVGHLLFDSKAEMAVIYGGNPRWTQGLNMDFLQLNKNLAGIDLADGNILWGSEYNQNMRVKVDGYGDIDDAEFDIRIVDDMVLANFTQIEVHDMKSGAKVFETSSGKDGSMNVVGPGPANFFAYPLVHNGILYRSFIGSVQAFHQTISVEALDMKTGKLLWNREDISRHYVKNMVVRGNLLILGFDRSDGIMALNIENGETEWEKSLGKSGITARWLVDENRIFAPSKSQIFLINATTGEQENVIDVESSVGFISELRMNNNKLFVQGKIKGVAVYDLQNLNLLKAYKTGFINPEIFDYDDIMIVSSSDLGIASPLLVFRSSDYTFLGSVKKSKKRSMISWNSQTGEVYELINGEIIKYKP
jgi:outer membrane protein assembly factor BamB